jgi:hypothetical protein
MSVSVNWSNIRHLNGSQEKAFEELCCQLAASEDYPDEATFWRVAAPDAGVECYWRLPNGKEHGWQAKFFRSPPVNQQWGQLDKSVKTALTKHPRLVRYTVCLPIDRSAPCIEGRQSFMDKWKTHVQKWKGWGKRNKISLEIVYWGEHEIWQKLSSDQHRGRLLFWFNREIFTKQWFEDRVAEATANAGVRYSPNLNVQLPITNLFDCLGRTRNFYSIIETLGNQIIKSHHRARSILERHCKNSATKLDALLENILTILANAQQNILRTVDWNKVVGLTTTAIDLVRHCDRELRDIGESKKGKEDFGYERHYLYTFIQHLQDVIEFAKGRGCASANLQVLVVTGDAGVGKTHLLCDIATNRTRSGLPTILLLGGQFRDDEPWSQIVRLLGLTCSRDEFLGALDTIGQIVGSRVLVLIDAMNEGEGPRFWYKYFAGMLTTVKRYPWIGLGVTVRTSYEDLVIPANLPGDTFAKEEHRGFTDIEYQAVQIFFAHYGIKQFVPLLTPEFRNPLFLKLLCEGLKNKGLTAIPAGLQGLTAIFEFFVDSVNERISKRLNIDPKEQIVSKAVQKISSMMPDKQEVWLERQHVKASLDELLRSHDYDKSLFKNLVSEGLLSEERFRVDDDQWQEVVRFSYEQFAHHAVVSELIRRHVDPADPCSAFLQDKPLGRIVENEASCWRYKNLVESLAIQLPERFGKELYEIAPHCVNYVPIGEAFLNTLMWRTPKSIEASTLTFINSHILNVPNLSDKLLITLLAVAVNAGHPYNADFLHKSLFSLDLADRDGWWSVFLHNHYDSQSAVDSLLDWAELSDKLILDNQSLRLFGTVLAWFFTCSNRNLRDRATKAMVRLIADRIDVLKEIILQFIDVNDPYVLERVFAVAYGCVLRNKSCAADLAVCVYRLIFEGSKPPPDILLRDYARGIIEVAIHSGAKLDIDLSRVRPPYNSDPPTAPPLATLVKYREINKNAPDEEFARVHLYGSVMGFGDFARYIIGTNNPSSFRWLSETLPRNGVEIDTTHSERYDVTAAQRWILKRIFDLGWSVNRFGRFDRRIALLHHDARGVERIGKKYQWIAYHEFLARMSDNYVFLGEAFKPKPERFHGPWQISGLRDIDPSFLLRKTQNEHTNAWWCPIGYDRWDRPRNHVQWLKESNDLPSFEKMLEVSSPNDGVKWLVLECYRDWKQPVAPDEDPDMSLRRSLYVMIRSYIVKQSDAGELFGWAKKQHFMGRWMPESRYLTDVFLGEYFWAPAYVYHDSPYYGECNWTRGRDDMIPRELLVSVEEYLNEYAGYDCSIDETVSLSLPSKWLVKELDLGNKGVEGGFFDDKSRLVAFDPSVKTPGPTALLVNRDVLIESLAEKGYTVLWTMLGEKDLIIPIGMDTAWQGRLEFSGVSMLDGTQWRRSLKTFFIKPATGPGRKARTSLVTDSSNA